MHPLRRLFRLLFSVLLALFFWFSVKLAQTTELTVDVPIAYSDLPENLALEKPLVQRMEARIRGVGHRMMWQALTGQLPTVQVNLADHALRGFVLTQDLTTSVRQSLNDGVQLLSLGPDTLHVAVATRQVKRVPLLANLKLEPKPGYRLRQPPRTQPDSVSLIGPARQLRNINQWTMPSLSVPDPMGKKAFAVRLANRDGMMVKPQTARLVVHTERYVEVSRVLGLEVEGQRYDEQLRFIPDYVTVHYQVPFSDYTELAQAELHLRVRADRLPADGSFVVPDVGLLDPRLQAFRLDPPQVRFVRRKLQPQ